MLTWIIIIAVLFIALIFLGHKNKFNFIKFIAILIIFIIILFSIFVSFTSQKVDLSTSSGVFNAISIYASWLGNTAVTLWNTGSDITGKVIDLLKI